MPIQNYSLLRGSVKDALPYKKGADHYQILVLAGGDNYRIAVDVYSQLKGSTRKYSAGEGETWDVDREVMFYKDEHYSHPFLDDFVEVAEGLTPAAELPKTLHLDFVRYDPPLFPLGKMKTVPPKDASGAGDDLNDDIDPWIQKAKNDPDAEIFAFGSAWDDAVSGRPDKTVYFDPNPTLGIHDIHMNQGDTGSEAKYNGVWQDGALLLRFGGADNDQWVAMFFRFVNQSTKTDEKGDP
jgi:uncharacterized protein YukJ